MNNNTNNIIIDADTAALRKSEANEKMRQLEANFRNKGFEQSEIEVEQDLQDAIKNLEAKVKQPYANTKKNKHKFKEAFIYPRTLKELTLRKVFLDKYKIQDIVKRLDRIDKQQEELQGLLKQYEERTNFPPLTKPTNLYVKTNTLPKTRRASFPSFPGKGLFSRLTKTIRGRQQEQEEERKRSQSAGAKRKRRNKTYKRKH